MSEPQSPLTWKDIGLRLRELKRLELSPGFVAFFLCLILLFGAILRLTGLDWDAHQHLHPDERFLTMVENSLSWPKSLGEYLDTAKNPLNPYNRGHGSYVYGLLPVILAKFFGQLVGKTGYDGVYLVGRALSAVMDLLSVLMVFLMGRRLYDSRVGLLGALLLSVTVLDIQHAHFFTVDTTTTFLLTLSLYMAVRVATGAGWLSILGLGMAFGLAVSSKMSALLFGLVIVFAFLLRAVRRLHEPFKGKAHFCALGRLRITCVFGSSEPGAPLPLPERALLETVRGAVALAAVIVVGFVVFRLAQPQAFVGPGFLDLKLNPQWKEDMIYIQKLVRGEIDYPPSHQWTAREPIWYMLKNQVLWGMGLPLGLAVWASWGLMTWELWRRKCWWHLLPWFWMSFTFFYQSVQFVKTIRYLLPIYPTMTLIAAYGLIRLWDAAKRRRAWLWSKLGGSSSAVALIIIGMVLVGAIGWALAFCSIYQRPHTRIAASRWIYENVPRGSTLSFELWDDPVPLNVDGKIAGAEYKQIQMDLYWEDIPEKREKLYEWLEQLDYIIL